jgi:hypothetical protein
MVVHLSSYRLLLSCLLLAAVFSLSVPAWAQESISAADNAWVLISAALVLIMIPGVGLFSIGMERFKKERAIN